MIDYINAFCQEYYPIISTVFGILAAAWTGIRIHSKYKDSKAKAERRLVDIEKRLYHIDDPKVGRVNKLSGLCDLQINSNKKAYALAMYVKGRQDSQ